MSFSRDRITGDHLHIPLGTHANKQGLVAGTAIAARAMGIDATLTFPGAEPLTVKMLADRFNRRVIGVQIVGKAGSTLRVDTAAMALWSGMTVDELAMIDLAYAPPFSPVWDPVQVAARAVIKELGY